MDIGTAIKTLRKEKKISQKKLAEECNISVNALCQIEKNVIPPKKHNMQNMYSSWYTDFLSLILFNI